MVDNELRDFVLGGVALEGEAKERFNEIQQQLAQLSTKFSNNVSMRMCTYLRCTQSRLTPRSTGSWATVRNGGSCNQSGWQSPVCGYHRPIV